MLVIFEHIKKKMLYRHCFLEESILNYVPKFLKTFYYNTLRLYKTHRKLFTFHYNRLWFKN